MVRVPTALMLLFLVGLVSRSATAQWLNYPSPGISRTPDGKPNLFAPTPHAPLRKTEAWAFGGFDISSSKETR